MPIKPQNRDRYPPDWPQIRERILKRAGNACEKCKAPNRTRIARGADRFAGTYQTSDAKVYSDEDGSYLGTVRMSEYALKRMVEVVLTIAHLDHVPENCDEANLRAWCQKCHLAYDQDHHQANARATRRSRLAVGELF